MDRPDLYVDRARMTEEQFTPAPPEGWWATDKERRRNRILGFWLLAACLFVVFAIGVVVGLAL